MVKNAPHWIKGFLRLSVVLYVVVWVAFSFYLVSLNADNVFLVQKHFDPYLSHPSRPSNEDWIVYTASQDFLSRSNAERLTIAERFFQKQQELAKELYFDTEELRSWFLETALMPVSESPIKEYEYFGGRPEKISYREFPLFRPQFRISKIFFSRYSFETSFFMTLALVTIIFLIFLAVRWVFRGFKNTAQY